VTFRLSHAAFNRRRIISRTEKASSPLAIRTNLVSKICPFRLAITTNSSPVAKKNFSQFFLSQTRTRARKFSFSLSHPRCLTEKLRISFSWFGEIYPGRGAGIQLEPDSAVPEGEIPRGNTSSPSRSDATARRKKHTFPLAIFDLLPLFLCKSGQ